MSFVDAVKKCFLECYFDFNGRARRSEYWWFFLFNIVVSSVLTAVYQPLGGLYTLVTLLPALGAGVRRLHDIGKSGWYMFISLIPLVGTILLIVFFATDSQHDNQYGPSPKYSDYNGMNGPVF